ncbi:MAG: 16S rRNA (guanine(527)-N(7))-methyltransferase RsmG [bacterium]|nr:16S rRNA (guanine(527)-N(7))-methyltransferase RsmG [bacterium]
MKKMIKRLVKGAEAFGIALSPEQAAFFDDYCENVLFWNRIAGLTAHRTEKEIIDFMFLDSLAGCCLREFINGRVCDLGTGGGFPGLPMKAVMTETDMSLMDSSEKKCAFLEKEIAHAGITGCRVICSQWEKSCEKFNTVLSRAFRDFSELIPASFRPLEENGMLIAWKGPGWREELKRASEKGLKEKFEIAGEFGYFLPESDVERTVLAIRKLS